MLSYLFGASYRIMGRELFSVHTFSSSRNATDQQSSRSRVSAENRMESASVKWKQNHQRSFHLFPRSEFPPNWRQDVHQRNHHTSPRLQSSNTCSVKSWWIEICETLFVWQKRIQTSNYLIPRDQKKIVTWQRYELWIELQNKIKKKKLLDWLGNTRRSHRSMQRAANRRRDLRWKDWQQRH